MKSKIIALVLAGTTILGTVSANACVRHCNSNNYRGHRYHCNIHHRRPCKPSQDEQPSTGDENVVNPPSTGDNNITTTPSTGDNTTITPTVPDDSTVITPSTGEEDTEVNQPTTGDNITVTPPTNEGDTVTDNNTNQSDKFMAEVEQAIFNKVNEERVKAGVAPLTYNKTMEKYARIKSQDMGDNNYFSHTDLNGNYITSKMKADGVSYNSWGENIAYLGGYGTNPTVLANQFMTNWMNSSGHRKNILSTNFTSIGVGVYKIGNKVYATQEFYR